MLKQILAMTWKDLKVFSKDRGGLVLIFAQPFMFILIMSYALSGVFRSGDRPIQILAANQDKGTQAASILRQLGELEGFAVETTWEGQTLTRQRAEQLIVAGKRNLALKRMTCRLDVEIFSFLQISSEDRSITSRIEYTRP